MTIQVRDLPSQQRITRAPQHRFTVEHRPYVVQPFMIAPVLPAETLTSASIQARAKTAPLTAEADLLGWWLEHYVFYVKLTDLEGRDDFTAMLLDANHDMSAQESSGSNRHTYFRGDGIDWVDACLSRVVDEFFRNEGEGVSEFTLDGMPMASVQGESWLDSVKPESEVAAADHEFPGEEPVVPDQYSEFGSAFTQWEHMRAVGLTSATFEDWIAAFGIKADTKPEREDHRPELLRYSRDWQYPSTVVDGGTGGSTSAVIWNIAERLDKRRLFNEPGFIFGVTVARPKVYLSNQKGTAAAMLSDAYAWLPAVLRDAPFTSLKRFDTFESGVSVADGPLGSVPLEAYWVDVRDLFIYGDQFTNFDLASTPAGFVALPRNSLQRRYPIEADIDALFKDAAVSGKTVRQDGIASLNILGMQRDTT